MRPRQVGAQRGFTLLELLVALSLSVLLLTLLAAAMRQVAGDWERSRGRLDQRFDTALGLLQLERAFEGSVPHDFLDEKNQLRLYFEGDSRGVSWVSTVSPGGASGATAWRIDGTVVGGDDDDGVRLYLAPAFADDPSERLDEAESRVLLPGFSATIHYLKQDSDKPEEREWVDEWAAEERRMLPAAVRVVLEPLEEGREPLEMVAEIAANTHPKVRPQVGD